MDHGSQACKQAMFVGVVIPEGPNNRGTHFDAYKNRKTNIIKATITLNNKCHSWACWKIRPRVQLMTNRK